MSEVRLQFRFPNSVSTYPKKNNLTTLSENLTLGDVSTSIIKNYNLIIKNFCAYNEKLKVKKKLLDKAY